MIFGALGTWQAWALVALAAALAWWLFRLKVRPPRRSVPSLVLWRQVIAVRREESWWDRVRRAVSLAVTVLVAVALALALARPGPRAQAADGSGRILIVLDASWSMRARTPEGDTRWERAVAAARALALSSGVEVAIATTADGLIEGPTADAALITTAFERLEPAGGDGFVWPRLDGLAATHFFTDGAIVRNLDAATIVHSVFRPAPNVAITAFGVRPATTTGAGATAYLEVANYAPAAQRAHLTVARGAAVILDRWLDLEPDEVSREIVPLEATGGATLRARVSAPENALDVDDEAVAWLPAGDPIAVTVVSDAPETFRELLAHDPSVEATFVRPAEYTPGRADALVFDRWAPDVPPERPALFVSPPPRSWLATAGPEEAAPRWVTSEEHPVLDGVDPLPLDIVRARRYEGGAVKALAQSSRGTPLVFVVDGDRTRSVVLAFGLEDSNLASVTAFPVLVGNALDWLARPAAGEARAPGPIELPASTTRVTASDGAAVPLVRAGDRVMARLRGPGLYLVQAGGAESVIGVNVGSPAVANLSRTTLSDDDRSAPLQAAGRPWWVYAVVLAFVLAAVEWWTWQRRLTV